MKKIILTILKICIPIFIVFICYNIYKNNKIIYNDKNQLGNTSLNIQNGGFFAEYNNIIYFINHKDNDSIYSLNQNLLNAKKINNMPSAYLNTGKGYLFYSKAINPRLKTLDNVKKSFSSSSSKTGFENVISGTKGGIFRQRYNSKTPKQLNIGITQNLMMYGNVLYFQLLDSKNGFYLEQIPIFKNIKHFKKLELSNIDSHISIDNNLLYYTNKTHQIESINIFNGQKNLILDTNAYLLSTYGNYLYFINQNDNNSLYRYSIFSETQEKLVDGFISTYNISYDGSKIYYQIDKSENNSVYEYNTMLKKSKLLINGDYSNIFSTKNYIFFIEFNSKNIYYKTNESDTIYSFNPPVLK